MLTSVTHNEGKGKGKVKVDHTAGHEGPELEKGYSSTLTLTSVLDGVGGNRHAPTALPPGKRAGTHCTWGWVGPRAGLDGCGKSRRHQDSIPGPSSPYRLAIPTELSRPLTSGKDSRFPLYRRLRYSPLVYKDKSSDETQLSCVLTYLLSS